MSVHDPDELLEHSHPVQPSEFFDLLVQYDALLGDRIAALKTPAEKEAQLRSNVEFLKHSKFYSNRRQQEKEAQRAPANQPDGVVLANAPPEVSGFDKAKREMTQLFRRMHRLEALVNDPQSVAIRSHASSDPTSSGGLTSEEGSDEQGLKRRASMMTTHANLRQLLRAKSGISLGAQTGTTLGSSLLRRLNNEALDQAEVEHATAQEEVRRNHLSKLYSLQLDKACRAAALQLPEWFVEKWKSDRRQEPSVDLPAMKLRGSFYRASHNVKSSRASSSLATRLSSFTSKSGSDETRPLGSRSASYVSSAGSILDPDDSLCLCGTCAPRWANAFRALHEEQCTRIMALSMHLPKATYKQSQRRLRQECVALGGGVFPDGYDHEGARGIRGAMASKLLKEKLDHMLIRRRCTAKVAELRALMLEKEALSGVDDCIRSRFNENNGTTAMFIRPVIPDKRSGPLTTDRAAVASLARYHALAVAESERRELRSMVKVLTSQSVAVVVAEGYVQAVLS